jgi:hypothetical protein
MCQCKNKIAKKKKRMRIKSYRRKIEGGGNIKKKNFNSKNHVKQINNNQNNENQI